ncbi:MAG: rod-binding protein [Pirellulaceae bacterium]
MDTISQMLNTVAGANSNSSAKREVLLQKEKAIREKMNEEFADLGGNLGDSPEAGLDSIFLSMMIKELRGSSEDGGLFAGEGSDVYGGMFDMMMSQAMSKSQPLGLGKQVIDSMVRQQLGIDYVLATEPENTATPNADQATS